MNLRMRVRTKMVDVIMHVEKLIEKDSVEEQLVEFGMQGEIGNQEGEKI